jgi:hypothetical protein
MSRDKRLERFASQLQVFHGFDINVESRAAGPGSRIWEFHIPKTGFRIQGTYAQVFAALKGYQAGYLAGRVYTRVEQQGLRDLIAQVEARFRAA